MRAQADELRRLRWRLLLWRRRRRWLVERRQLSSHRLDLNIGLRSIRLSKACDRRSVLVDLVQHMLKLGRACRRRLHVTQLGREDRLVDRGAEVEAARLAHTAARLASHLMLQLGLDVAELALEQRFLRVDAALLLVEVIGLLGVGASGGACAHAAVGQRFNGRIIIKLTR